MKFGDRLREMRLQKGLTQEQLAQQIGVAKSTLTGYEKGNREPDVFKIKKILEILDVDSDYLLGVSRVSDLPKTETADNFSEHEKSLILAYRGKPEMQPAVDKLLGLEPQEEMTVVYRAAKSETNTPGGFVEMPVSRLKKIQNAPRVLRDEDI